MLLVLFSACTTAATEEQSATTDAEATTTNAATASADTLTISTRCAVMFEPDSLQIEKRMQEAGEENFRAGADDYLYYMNLSAEYLEKQGLPVTDAKSSKYLRFVLADKSIKLIKTDTLPGLWGFYLFDPTMQPHYADILAMEDEYQAYYK